jgi:hypothetical protein
MRIGSQAGLTGLSCSRATLGLEEDPIMIRATVLAGLSALLLAGPAWAAGAETHSGSVGAVDLERHTLTVEEMGPWRGPASRPASRSIRFTPETVVTLVQRSTTPPPEGWPGGYVEAPLAVSEIRPGDFVSVTVARHEGRITARSIDVVRPTEP